MWNRAGTSIQVFLWLTEPLLRAGVRSSLRGAGEAGIVESDGLRPGPGVHVVVTDWSAGLQLAERSGDPALPRLPPHTRILVIAPQVREHAMACALRGGVHGLILSSCTPEELIQAIRALAQGASYISPEVAQRMTAFLPRMQLTAREAQVLRLLARGQCNKAIARQLEIAPGTVKTHVKAIMAKLDADSRTEAACIAVEKGLVEVPGFRSPPSARGAAAAPHPAAVCQAHGA